MFTSKTRDDGTVFYTLSDDAPDGLLDAVQEAHRGAMPNDWIWAECKAAFEEEADLTDPDALHEYADGRMDVYTKALHSWAADMCLTDLYSSAEEEANDLLPPTATTLERIGAIQFCAIQGIAATIATWKADQ